jgi:hypothetical protein
MDSIESRLSDLHMMVVTGGIERTRDEVAPLLARAELSVVSQAALPSGKFIVEAIRREV